MAERIVSVGELTQALIDAHVRPEEVNGVTQHEESHANADTEGIGEFGIITVPATIEIIRGIAEDGEVITDYLQTEIALAAFYHPVGERSPEVLAKIASAPGFSEMSQQDYLVYYYALSLISQKEKQNPKPASPNSPRSSGAGASQGGPEPAPEAEPESEEFLIYQAT